MYSYEDRMKAVRLYIKLGMRVRATIRQLGYPTKNSLKAWHREYEQRRDLAPRYVRKPRYSQAQKVAAVEHFVEHGCSVSATIKALGYPGRGSLPLWVQELRPELGRRVVGKCPVQASLAVKRGAVIALCTRHGSALEVAQEVGVCRPTLYNWKKQLLGAEASASMKRSKESPPGPERA